MVKVESYLKVAGIVIFELIKVTNLQIQSLDVPVTSGAAKLRRQHW